MSTSAVYHELAVAWNPLDKDHREGLPLYTQEDVDFYQLVLGWEVDIL